MTTNKLPAITPDYLTAQIVDVKYYRDTEFSPALTTCHLKMRNGFIVEGKSAVMDMARFDEAMGKEIAYKDAFEKLWRLEGYAMAFAHMPRRTGDRTRPFDHNARLDACPPTIYFTADEVVEQFPEILSTAQLLALRKAKGSQA